MRKRRPVSLLLYLPAFHRGHIELFKRHAGSVDTLWIFGKTLLRGSRESREIRALQPATARKLVASLAMFPMVRILGPLSIRHLLGHRLVLSRDQLSQVFAQRYLRGKHITWDTAFLRWDAARILSRPPANYDRVTSSPFHRRMMALARHEADKSSDWWRHVGAVLVRNRRVVLVGYNEHMPSEHSPYAVGDTRDFLSPGKKSNLSKAIHGEQQIVAMAARRGVRLKGASMYVTVFPCPVCAKLIARSGIKRCYFASGHSSLGGDQDMKREGVELVLVR